MTKPNPALYRWKRWTDVGPAVPTTKKVQNNDVQDWIKKVQEASDNAAAVTFGLRSHGDRRSAAMATVDALHDHDDAYTEAQDLLNQWVMDKCVLEDDDDSEIWSPSTPPSRSEVKRQWDNLLAEEEDMQFPTKSSDRVVREIEECDEESTVDSILQSLMEKDVVEEKYLDLGLDDSRLSGRNPTLSMQARHQRVKENREKRREAAEKQIQEKQRKKEAQFQAQQIVLKEERQKTMQRKKEEQLIQQEMTKIRKKMEEQKRLVEEAKRREKRIVEAEQEAKERRELARREEELRKLQAQEMIETERKELSNRLKEMKSLTVAGNRRCLQKHFSHWYNVVMNRRIQMGKARAMADWRCLIKAWNGWRHFIRHKHMKREEKEIEMTIKQTHRKKQAAEQHYRCTLLKKCFVAWQLWIIQEQKGKELFETKQETKDKMSAFLQAAASGQLWTAREEKKTVVNDPQEETCDTPNTRKIVDDLFSKTVHRVPRNTQSNTDEQSREDKTLKKPKFAWQVTRRHLDLTSEQLGNPVGDEIEPNNAVLPRDAESEGRMRGAATRRPIPYTVNNFQHRYAAQQRILQEQQRQLKEQQRLILEMQATQNQQKLQQELNNIHGISSAKQNKKEINKMEDGSEVSVQPYDNNGDGDDGSDDGTGSEHSSAKSCNSNLNNVKKNKAASNFVKGMEERAARIAQRKAEANERKQKREEEKLARIKEEERRRREEEEAEKKAKIEKAREERRLIKQREEEKQQRLQLITRQNEKADVQYRRSLLYYKGLKPLIQLVEKCHKQEHFANEHHNLLVMRKCFVHWKEHVEEITRQKKQLADELYKNILLRRTFSSWKRYDQLQSIQLQRARRHFAYCIKVKYFKCWEEYVVQARLEAMRKEELALEHNELRIMRLTFHAWRNYPKYIKAEAEKQKRREEMRKKVQAILPDFGMT